jgi:hypothetical protein
MSSIIKVDTIQNQSGANIISENSNTITVGASGDTTNIIGTLNKDGISVSNTPAWSASLSADTAVADATVTKIPCNTEWIDTDSAYDNSTNYRFTVPSGKDGNYYVHASVRNGTSSDFDSFYLYIKKNGSDYLFNSIRSEFRETTEINNVIPLVAGDYLEMFVYQGTGGSINMTGSSTQPFATNFSGFKLT